MIIVALLLQLSCVTKASRELVEVQLDATQTALSARSAACFEEARDCALRLQARDESLAELAARHEALAARHEKQDAELAALRAQLGAELFPETAARVAQALSALSEAELSRSREAAHFAAWQARLSSLEAQGRLTLRQQGADVVVRIPTVQIFNEGRVSVSPRGEVLLTALSEAVAGAPRGPLRVVAHTDDTPYHSAAFSSNWELGFAQAMVLVRALQLDDDSGPISAASAAGTAPLTTGDSEAGRKRSRRLELTISPPPTRR